MSRFFSLALVRLQFSSVASESVVQALLRLSGTCMDVLSMFTHLPVGEHLGHFQGWGNKAPLNIVIQMFI